MCRSATRVFLETVRKLIAAGSLAILLVASGCAEPAAETSDASQASQTEADTDAALSDGSPAAAQPQSSEPPSDATEKAGAEGVPDEARRAGQFRPLAPPDSEQFPGLERLAPEYDVWTDPANKRVVLRGGVCLREGPIELFACIHQWVPDEFAEGGTVRRGTKEYESIVTINTTAALVHTALLAVGAEPGSPVRFTPEYEPAHGTPVDVLLYWEDAAGESHEARAQDWIRNVETGEPMDHTWVFAGSGFRVNQQTGERRYLAEEGNLICVSNFPDAVLDLPIKSSSSNASLLFEAFTGQIPPVGTPVTIVLVPEASGDKRPLE